MRSILNGTLSFGLVAVPVKLYAATEDRELTAHQVHTKDHGKISYRKVCAECGETVDSHSIAKQFELDGQTAILTDDDLSVIDVGKSREITVKEFVPADSIDPVMVEKSYYVGPAADTAMKAYALLSATLEKCTAIVQYTMRSHTRLAALSVTGKGILVLHNLRWADEIRPAVLPALDTAILERQDITEAERQMAETLVQSMTVGQFEPNKYRDEFQTELRELVMSKLSGEDAPDDVSDLLAKLEASVKPKPDIREWASANGITLGKRGRIPADVTAKYEAAVA